MAPDTLVAPYIDVQRRSALSTILLTRALWDRLGYGDFSEHWVILGPQVQALVASAQLAAAVRAGEYVDTALGELGITTTRQIRPLAFSDITSAGTPLAELLYRPIMVARHQLGGGVRLLEALSIGRNVLDSIIHTLIADAARAAEITLIIAHPEIPSWVRRLSPNSCPRCISRAGFASSWDAPFYRHPGCFCVHEPSTGEPVAAPPIGPASEGMSIEQSVSGLSTRSVRARPETIAHQAADRPHAIARLASAGYLR